MDRQATTGDRRLQDSLDDAMFEADIMSAIITGNYTKDSTDLAEEYTGNGLCARCIIGSSYDVFCESILVFAA